MEGLKLDYQVTKHVETLSENKRGGTLELNRTQCAGYPEKWDIRRWYIDENGEKRMGKGISLTDEEMDILHTALERYNVIKVFGLDEDGTDAV